MTKIDTLFDRLRAEGKKAFIPFLTAGDPDLEFTEEALLALANNGAAVCEVGVPYSDPIADGPVIQASYSRALSQGTSVSDVLECTGRVAAAVDVPQVTMVSYSIVHRRGRQAYLERASELGIAGVIIPDLPNEEADDVASLCEANHLSLIQLITPTTTRHRAERIVHQSSGFIYCVSITGITGERDGVPTDLRHRVEEIRELTSLPICVGFGISQPEHVRAIAPIADGVIVGSAFVRRIANNDGSRESLIKDLAAYAREMIAALNDS